MSSASRSFKSSASGAGRRVPTNNNAKLWRFVRLGTVGVGTFALATLGYYYYYKSIADKTKRMNPLEYSLAQLGWIKPSKGEVDPELDVKISIDLDRVYESTVIVFLHDSRVNF